MSKSRVKKATTSCVNIDGDILLLNNHRKNTKKSKKNHNCAEEHEIRGQTKKTCTDHSRRASKSRRPHKDV